MIHPQEDWFSVGSMMPATIRDVMRPPSYTASSPDPGDADTEKWTNGGSLSII